MSFNAYFGWGLLVPLCLSLAYGYASSRVMDALGYEKKRSIWGWAQLSLPAALLFTLWSAVNIPLPLLYVLAFVGKLAHLLRKRENRVKEIFLINLTHLTMMALHLILISALSLALGISMSDLLREPLWRIVTIGAVLLFHTLADWLILRWEISLAVVRTQSDSEEVRPFIVFLWFCHFFLLFDSVLCISDLRWGLLPVFLMASTVLLEFYLFCSLRHIYSILRVHYLEAEHQRLIEELERRNRSAAELRDKSYTDSMTGIFSRRYLMEHISFLLEKKSSFSLVYIDLDHLKQVNDQEGHRAGDHYLIEFTEAFGARLRQMDFFARIGGDEFVTLLLDCDQEDTTARMEEIRFELAKDQERPFSFSFGVAVVDGDSSDSAEALLRRADQAMYQDKAKQHK